MSDKFIELLKGMGGSEELTKAAKEELANFSSSVKSNFEQEYQKKIERAKQICVEEVAKEKAVLAKRVKTFLESKAASMEQAAARARAIEESESAARLKKAKAILEGVEVKETGVTSQALEDANKKIARLEKAITSLKEERTLAVQKANTANEIAAKALQRSRQLETKLETKVETKPLAEGYCADHKLPYPKDGKCAKCGGAAPADKKDEEKVEETKATATPAPALDAGREVAAESKSTRRTMVESQTRNSAQPVTEISKIAETIE